MAVSALSFIPFEGNETLKKLLAGLPFWFTCQRLRVRTCSLERSPLLRMQVVGEAACQSLQGTNLPSQSKAQEWCHCLLGLGFRGERLLRAQAGEKHCRGGKSRPAGPRRRGPGLGPRNHGHQGPSAPVPRLRAALEHLRGRRWDARQWAQEAVLSGPPPHLCPMLLSKILEHCT